MRPLPSVWLHNRRSIELRVSVAFASRLRVSSTPIAHRYPDRVQPSSWATARSLLDRSHFSFVLSPPFFPNSVASRGRDTSSCEHRCWNQRIHVGAPRAVDIRDRTCLPAASRSTRGESSLRESCARRALPRLLSRGYQRPSREHREFLEIPRFGVDSSLSEKMSITGIYTILLKKVFAFRAFQAA